MLSRAAPWSRAGFSMVVGSDLPDVRFGSSVATAATDGQMRKRRRLVLVFRSCHWFRAFRMTEETARCHCTLEVRVWPSFVSRR